MEEPLFFDQTIKRIEFIFRYSGINITSGERTENHLKSRIIYIFNFFCLSLELAGEYFWFIDGVIQGTEFLELTYNAPCVVISSMGVFKAIFMMSNEEHVHKLMDNLRKFEIQETKRKQTQKKEKIIRKERKFLHTVLGSINVVYMTVVTNFGICPLIMMAAKYYQTGEVELMFPFLVWYPFDEYQITFWPFVYLHQVWAETMVCLNICAADYFFFTCCSYIRIQFRLLREEFENIVPAEVSTYRKYSEDNEFKSNLKDLIKWHQELIQLTESLEKTYSKSFLMNLLSSSLVICLTGFNVTMVNDTVLVITFLSFLSTSLTQVFFLCFFADLLMTSSMEIGDAVYNSLWYMTEPKIRKQLLIVLTRCQKPCQLTASGYADVNLNSFMRVLSTSWSYFALLQTMYGD